MEEDNDLEQVTGSPTAGENGFVHVESVDSAQTDGGSINQVVAEHLQVEPIQVEHLEQDDGVVVTGADTVQVEPQDARVTEDVGPDEFVDCPDDLIAGDLRSPGVGNTIQQQPFKDATEDILVLARATDEERQILPQDDEEEGKVLMKEVSFLHHQLKVLSKQQSPVDGNDAGVSSDQLTLESEEGGERSLSLHEMINECFKLIELSLKERSQAEDKIRELNATLHMKDKEIEDFMARDKEHSISQDVGFNSDEVSSVEATVDRVLYSLATALSDAELSDTSVGGKLSYIEKNTSFLLEKYHHFLSEIEMLSNCLAEVNSDFHIESVCLSVREELLRLKKRELELADLNSHLEYQQGQLMEQVDKGRDALELLNAEIGNLKGEVEQEKTRYSNTKEKLSMAVTKGKALVQQRDSLKQSVAEKTSELERLLTELQEKSSALEAAELRIDELTRTAILANSLQEALSQRDMVLAKCGEMLLLSGAAAELQSSDITEGVTWLANERSRLVPLALEFQRVTDVLVSSLELPQATQFDSLESQIRWLLESYNLAKDQFVKLQDQIHTTREADLAQIDRLTAAVLAEAQEKNSLNEELKDLTCKYEGIAKEKEQMVALLLEASQMSVDGLEDVHNLRSDMAMVINRCYLNIKEQAIASIETTPMDIEVLERVQQVLYVTDLESKLYEEIINEEKIYRSEFDNQSNEILKVSEELHASKEEIISLQINLQRSEEKASVLREKLSMAVKKGKGLVQERENMKQVMAEKNAQIEALTLDLQKQESTISGCRDQISILSDEVKVIAKLESDLLHSKEERDQIEQFLLQSNTKLQQVVQTVDGIILPVDVKEPVEKLKWVASYLSECQVAKAQAEQELGDVKNEAGMLASKLTEALTTLKSLEDALSVSEKNISQLAEDKRKLELSTTSMASELQKTMEESHISKTQAEQEVQILNEEISTLNKKLVEALTSLKSLEDTLSDSKKTITQLNEEKRELEFARSHAEAELKKAIEGATSQTNVLQEVSAGKKSLEEALSLAENKISVLVSEKEEAQASKAAAEMELHKVKEEMSAYAIKLDEAYQSIKFLEDAISQLKTNASQFSQEKEEALEGRLVLENELKKLKEEVEYHERKFVDASAELSASRKELTAKHDRWVSELSGFFGNLQVLLKDGSLLSLLKQSFAKKIESLKEIDHLLKDMKDNFDSEQLQEYPAIEEISQSAFLSAGLDNDWSIGMFNDEFNAEDTDGVISYAGKMLDNLNTRNQFLADQFGGFSTLIDNLIASLLRKLVLIRNTMPLMVQESKALQHNAKSLQMDKQIHDNRAVMMEHGIKFLVSVCADVTKELKFNHENNMLQTDSVIGLEKSNIIPFLDVRIGDEEALADVKSTADELFFAARNVQSLIEQYATVKKNMSNTIEHLQEEVEKTSSMHDKSKEVIEEYRSVKENMSTAIEELQGDLERTRSMYHKAKEENDAFCRRVNKLETELEASGNMCNEMISKLEDYRAREDNLNEREVELSARSTSSVKVHEGDTMDALLSASQIKALFDKIDGITIPFPNLVAGYTKPHDSDPVKKLFYIVDSVNELLDQITLLSHAKEELRSTVSKQSLENEQLTGEFKEVMKGKQDSEKMGRELFELSIGLQNIIRKLGDESVGVKKSADVAGLLPVLERLVQGVLLDSENSKFKAQDMGSKLLETQKVVEELTSKIKLLEDYIQNRKGTPDMTLKGGVFESPSLPARSEISEIDDQVPVGKAGLPLVPSAAHVRSLRKGSSEQLAINIDSESDRLLDKTETVEDKGHMFKSLHTSGLVPVKGKMIADRLDGIWVSGGQALMRRPRARLGLIAYWLVLHLWLLGTIL